MRDLEQVLASKGGEQQSHHLHALSLATSDEVRGAGQLRRRLRRRGWRSALTDVLASR